MHDCTIVLAPWWNASFPRVERNGSRNCKTSYPIHCIPLLLTFSVECNTGDETHSPARVAATAPLDLCMVHRHQDRRQDRPPLRRPEQGRRPLRSHCRAIGCRGELLADIHVLVLGARAGRVRVGTESRRGGAFSVVQAGAPYPSLTMLVFLLANTQESLTKSMTTAHVFLVDHLVSTVWTVMFGIDWWVYNPHDGQRPALSPPQQEIADVGPGKRPDMTPEELLEAAHGIWNQEKGSAAAVLFIGWMLKVSLSSSSFQVAPHSALVENVEPRWRLPLPRLQSFFFFPLSLPPVRSARSRSPLSRSPVRSRSPCSIRPSWKQSDYEILTSSSTLPLSSTLTPCTSGKAPIAP